MEDECNAIVPILRNAFINEKVKDETNVAPLVRACLQKRKLEKADELLIGKWGMSYAYPSGGKGAIHGAAVEPRKAVGPEDALDQLVRLGLVVQVVFGRTDGRRTSILWVREVHHSN